jgi:tRNA (guanine37-N1)-methyltransferase
MPKESLCIKVPKIHGEKIVFLTKKFAAADKELKVQRNTDFIYVPLVRPLKESELKALTEQVSDFQLSTRIFQEREKSMKTLAELLESKLPPHLLASLPRSIDIVGDIAIVDIPPELGAHRRIIGEAALKLHGKVRTVLTKASAVSGTYRVRKFEIIAGQSKTETVHKEHGCKYCIDLAKAYFSPRLSYEHKRVATLIQKGETIVDLFAGVGPFSVLIAKNNPTVRVYSVDVNPHAIEFLKKNIRLNRVEGRVYPILGDARQVVEERLFGIADRLIMNLPEKAMEFVDTACEAINPNGGIVHLYSFIGAPENLENMKLRLKDAVKNCGRNVEKILFSRNVRETAPYKWQAVLDAKIH